MTTPTEGLGAATRLVLLDSPHLRHGGVRHELPPSAPAALLAVLGATGDWIARERLMTLFWPDASESDAQHHLRVTLHRSRQLLAGWGLAEHLGSERRRLRLALACDVPEFRRAVGAARWSEAVALHRAPLLSSFSLRGFAALDEWMAIEREALAAAWRNAALRQAAALEASGDAAGAAALLQSQLEHDLLAEDALQAFLRVAAAAGTRDAALDACDRFRRRARDELGLEPLPGTLALATALRRAEPRSPVAIGVQAPAVPAAVLQPPLVGRAAELARLQKAGPGLLVVSGEPGVGKSRLVAEAWPGALWLRCRDGRRGQPLHALTESLQQTPVGRIASLLPQAADRRELARLLPALSPNEVLAPLEAGSSRLLEVVEALLPAWAGKAAIVIDDLQWSDASLLEVLQRVLAGHRLTVVATLRTAEAGAELGRRLDSIEAQGGLQRLELAPLPAVEVGHLVARLAGRGAPRFAAWLHRRSGGNPFFALETLRALFESGQLGSTADGWRSDLDALSTDYAELQVPPRVAALVRQRVGALSESAQRVLSVAALAGGAEHLEALAEIAGLSPWATARAVADGQAAGLLVERRFAHDLMQEALVAGIPEPLRAVLHAGIARRLAAQLPPHRLAEHWWSAGDEAAAVDATLAAAMLDGERGLHAAAATMLEAAHARSAMPHQQARLEVARAGIARQVGEVDAAADWARAALQSLPLPPTRQQALVELFEVELLRGDLDDAGRWLEQARALDPEAPPLWMAGAKLAHARGDYSHAAELLERRVARLRQARPAAELAAALTSLATTYDSLGQSPRALTLHTEAVAMAQRLGARYVEVEAAANLVWSLDELGRLDEAIAAGEQALSLGDYDATPFLASNLAYVYLRRGRLGDAEGLYGRLARGDDATLACVASGKLADIAAGRGDAAALRHAVAAALRLLPRTQIYTAQVSAIVAVLRHGDAEQAAQARGFVRSQPVDPGLQQRLDDALRESGPA